MSMPPSALAASHWHANLQLLFRRVGSDTRLVASRHQGPLYVQRPFYPEGRDLAHVYLLHPPGGMVSGDRLDLELELEEESRVLCTTPGAGRAYRARADRSVQEQSNHLRVARGSTLEWFPQELIVFPEAHVRVKTQVELDTDALFAGWDISVLGLPASGRPFLAGRLDQRLVLLEAGKCILNEHLRLDMAQPELFYARAGLHGMPVNGIFIAGPFEQSVLQSLPYEQMREASQAGGVTAENSLSGAICRFGRLDRYIVGRYLGHCAQQARACFLAWWALLRPLLMQRPLCLPAIWST